MMEQMRVTEVARWLKGKKKSVPADKCHRDRSEANQLKKQLLRSDLESVNHRIIGRALGELDDDLATGYGHRKRPIHCDERSAGLCDDVEIIQNGRAVDEYVKHTLPGAGKSGLRELQRDVVISVRHRNRVCEIAPAARLVQSRGIGVRDVIADRTGGRAGEGIVARPRLAGRIGVSRTACIDQHRG